ncbi:hypothetical protein SRHO_G00005850 [Serrasalmus rhombeus]
MGGERIITSHLVSGLEVSSLENNDFFKLPNVFSQAAIPAREKNIPRQEDVDKWPHLSQVHLPRIQAGIDLLIGSNIPRALELWQGYAVEIPSGELSRDDGKIWYLPHHGVYHPKKLKIRVVFDCGASYQGTTLNGQLLRGPDITSTLLGVIIRFRQEEVAVMADVEAMFHQVKVADEDADLLRFLWWPAGDISQDLKEYRMTVHLFGATSSPSCANFALRKCAEDNRDRFGALGINTVLHNFYVDDCLKSAQKTKLCVYTMT